ncbi:hypothetical protein DPMN_042822 [Dreissena polymorpha]|uniref:Uncharacterized protein n=1 Tax=Dreissena polymorpha TaxID=45954 RepID=A0A9D4D134_DREPO|nr:hypothetical protein DPMN_042822 [Dreissena polymorpha]
MDLLRFWTCSPQDLLRLLDLLSSWTCCACWTSPHGLAALVGLALLMDLLRLLDLLSSWTCFAS